MLRRKLGRHDVELSIVGFGGIVVRDRPQDEADREVAEAIDRGICYFDVAPQYGTAQEILGPALRPHRDRVTLACKTLARDAAGAAADLDDSLTKLCTDRFDIYQMHGFPDADHARRALGAGGAIEAFVRAREQGKVRLLGFSSHSQEAALLAIESGLFDTVLYPVNYLCWTRGGFGEPVVDAARQRGMGVMALKSLARCPLAEGADRPYEQCWYQPEDRPELAELLLRWTLSRPGVCAAVPPGAPALFGMAVDFAERFTPIDAAGVAQLEAALGDCSPLFSAESAAV